MLTKKYRIKEIRANSKTIYYPEYCYNLFPYYWARLKYNIWSKSKQKNEIIQFDDLDNAKCWLKRYMEDNESIEKTYNIQ